LTIVRVPQVDDEGLPTKAPTHLLINLAIVVDAVWNAIINPNLAESTPTIDATNTEHTSFDNSNIYNKIDNDLLVMLTTPTLLSESVSQVPQLVPRL
jgi:hypothetical protein